MWHIPRVARQWTDGTDSDRTNTPTELKAVCAVSAVWIITCDQISPEEEEKNMYGIRNNWG